MKTGIRCPDPDALVLLNAMFEQRGATYVGHIAACDLCRDRLGRLAEFREALDATVEMSVELRAAIDRRLRAAATAETGLRHRAPRRAVTSIVNAALAGLTAFTALLALPGAPTISAAGVGAVLLAAAVLAFETRATRRASAAVDAM